MYYGWTNKPALSYLIYINNAKRHYFWIGRSINVDIIIIIIIVIISKPPHDSLLRSNVITPVHTAQSRCIISHAAAEHCRCIISHAAAEHCRFIISHAAAEHCRCIISHAAAEHCRCIISHAAAEHGQCIISHAAAEHCQCIISHAAAEHSRLEYAVPCSTNVYQARAMNNLRHKYKNRKLYIITSVCLLIYSAHIQGVYLSSNADIKWTNMN